MSEILENSHIGHKIRRIRELKGVKQESLAAELGISRQTVSKIEQSDTIDEEMLDRIARALDVPVERIKGFNEDAIINIISSTLYDNAGSINNNSTLNFNPIEKLVALFEENKNLYERMLETERSKIKLLEDQLKSLKK
ncbi:helix-turn-helix domain-containing protein [Algoriphagus sp. Y33]|uniref:helix-turn-helix domain-containing protein n=1 Tax=Algoriphagus sp. Y33 TaxID=2772483 RepID=UPI0017859FEE|nr:helix-turn-helix transcriptional regulator [Algoriphagus sp. Y33]